MARRSTIHDYMVGEQKGLFTIMSIVKDVPIASECLVSCLCNCGEIVTRRYGGLKNGSNCMGKLHPRRHVYHETQIRNVALCWHCKRCYNGCSWSREGKFVEGSEYSIKECCKPNGKGYRENLYIITKCPLFEDDRRK